jgi:hypothetical protein
MYRFNVISVKIPEILFFGRNGRADSILLMELQGILKKSQQLIINKQKIKLGDSHFLISKYTTKQ